MEIQIGQLLAGAREARGLTVIIDVFRAFSTACYVSANGAAEIRAVGDLDLAYRLRRENPARVLMGEREGVKCEGFDFGNSPAEIEKVNFAGRSVVHTTSAGTQGIANALGADEVVTGSFPNADAVLRYILRKKPEKVSLVCMGQGALRPTDEDSCFAEYLRDRLLGRSPDFEGIRRHLRGYITAQKFFDPEKDWAPERDFDLCLSLSRFDFVLKAEAAGDGSHFLRRVES